MVTQHLRELMAEEARLLRKFDRVAKRRMAIDPRLTYSAALAAACQVLPNAYAHLCDCREQLAAAKIRPQLLDGLRLGRGPR